jgi:hypothetical protein
MTTTSPLGGEATYRVKDDGLGWRESGGQIVVLDLHGSVYFGLNATASRLWKVLAHSVSRADLIAELVAGASVEEARAAADVDAFLADLERNDLLVKN